LLAFSDGDRGEEMEESEMAGLEHAAFSVDEKYILDEIRY
jgi:hypothetical protein